MAAQRVLSVGQCHPDHDALARVLADRFGAETDRAATVDEAMSALAGFRWDLVLVNRIIFDDNGPGIELVRRMRADPRCGGIPVMMISNHADAQAEAVAAGAVPGFGKDVLTRPAAVQALACHLRPRPEPERP